MRLFIYNYYINMNTSITFIPSNVHQGHYVYIDGESTGIVVNLFAYKTIDDYKQQIDNKINNYLKELDY